MSRDEPIFLALKKKGVDDMDGPIGSPPRKDIGRGRAPESLPG